MDWIKRYPFTSYSLIGLLFYGLGFVTAAEFDAEGFGGIIIRVGLLFQFFFIFVSTMLFNFGGGEDLIVPAKLYFPLTIVGGLLLGYAADLVIGPPKEKVEEESPPT